VRLWSSDLLEIELARGQLSEREKIKYLVLPMLFTALIGGPLAWIAPRYGLRPPRFDSLVAVLNGILMVAVTLHGIRKAYRINKQIDGRQFIERYVVLVLPVSIRFCVAMVPLVVLLTVGFHLLDLRLQGGTPRFLPLHRLAFPLATLWLYHLLASSFSRFGRHLRRFESQGL
jgi:hypothetical protein